MVCMPGHFKMASVLKLVMMENHATPDEMINEKSTAQILHKQLFDAHEPNLLDEDDMHIFGSKPMADPLDLVRCNTCKKPVKASQYAAHADRCGSGKVNTDSMAIDDDGSKKPPKKGRKIKLAINGNQKIHIKVKAKSPHENNNIVNGFKLDNNGNVNIPQFLDSAAEQNAAVPLATKMYHSQGNYRLRLELGQLYRKSCAEQSGSHATLNFSHENGLMVSQFSPDNLAVHGPHKIPVPQMKHLDQLLTSTPESCSRNPQQLPSSGPNRLQATKSHRPDTQVSSVRNDMTGSRHKKAAIQHSKNTGNKKTQQQSSRSVAVIKSSVD